MKNLSRVFECTGATKELVDMLKDLEKRGIELNEWQMYRITNSNRQVGKTFASYIIAYYNRIDNAVSPGYDNDLVEASRTRIDQWLKGFKEFILKYYPEHNPEIDYHKSRVILYNNKEKAFRMLEEAMRILKDCE